MSYFDKRKNRISYRNPKIFSITETQKQSKFKVAYLWLVLLLGLIFFIIWWLFYGDFFKIKNIEITGNINESIRKEIDGFKGHNILLFSMGQKDKEFEEEQTSIKKINIIKGIPDTLKIEVLLRKAEIRWEVSESEYFIDREGVVFSLDIVPQDDTEKPTVKDSKNIQIKEGSKIVSGEFVAFVVKLSDELPNLIDKKIQEIIVGETTFNIEVVFADSYKVYFSTVNNFSDQLYLLSHVIEKYDSDIQEYIDLRVENRAYYK